MGSPDGKLQKKAGPQQNIPQKSKVTVEHHRLSQHAAVTRAQMLRAGLIGAKGQLVQIRNLSGGIGGRRAYRQYKSAEELYEAFGGHVEAIAGAPAKEKESSVVVVDAAKQIEQAVARNLAAKLGKFSIAAEYKKNIGENIVRNISAISTAATEQNIPVRMIKVFARREEIGDPINIPRLTEQFGNVGAIFTPLPEGVSFDEAVDEFDKRSLNITARAKERKQKLQNRKKS